MRTWILVVLWCCCVATEAQSTSELRHVRFVPWFIDHPLVLDSGEVIEDGTPITITEFRFYVSHLAGSTHLIDAADPRSMAIDLASSSVHDSITFLLGIDSLTNVSGALGGDLDPTKGMYWTWNSGYINLKLEGSSPICPARKNEFQFHLGGYMPPFQSTQRLALAMPPGDVIEVRVDVAAMLQRIDLRTEYEVMSPGEKAVSLSRDAAKMFSCHASK